MKKRFTMVLVFIILCSGIPIQLGYADSKDDFVGTWKGSYKVNNINLDGINKHTPDYNSYSLEGEDLSQKENFKLKIMKDESNNYSASITEYYGVVPVSVKCEDVRVSGNTITILTDTGEYGYFEDEEYEVFITITGKINSENSLTGAFNTYFSDGEFETSGTFSASKKDSFFPGIVDKAKGIFGSEEEDEYVPVTDVLFKKIEEDVKVGHRTNLKATVFPRQASNKNIIWKSSDTSIAIVKINGVIIGISEGTTTIIATSEDNPNEYDVCNVTVIDETKEELSDEDKIRQEEGMTIFKEVEKTDSIEEQIASNQEKASQVQTKLEEIATNSEELIIEEGITYKDTQIAPKKIKVDKQEEGWFDKTIYWVKTKGLNKAIDKTLGVVNKIPGLDVISNYFKEKKDDLVLNDKEKVNKVKAEIGVKSDVAAQLYNNNNPWEKKSAGASVYKAIFEKNKVAKSFSLAIDKIVSVRKKDHANASEIEYNLIKGEINNLRQNGSTKEEAISTIKNRYVNQYYEHYGLETKKSDETWQDKFLSFIGLGGKNKIFGGANRDKMDTGSKGEYKDTNKRFDMVISVMDKNAHIYSDEEVMRLKAKEGGEGNE